MTPSDDLSPPRRPIFFPVVIATVFLTIIGMTAGFVLGERDRNQASDPGDTQETSSAPIVPSTPAVDGPLCPDETIKTAADSGLPTDLRQVLKIVTDTGTTVWICQDGAGSFYYQGKTGGDSPLVQHDNGLFLTDVTRESDDEYQAIDQKGNRFVVSRTQFELHFVTGKEQINKVIAVD